MKKIIILSAFTALTLSADPLVTYIGAKAKAMGGAFTAVANNNSAMYFNPAGLVNFDGLQNTMVTFEAGTGAKYDATAIPKERHTSSGSYFFGLSIIGKESGFGFAIYSLYDLNLNSSSGYQQENVSVMSLSVAFNLVDKFYPYGGKLSLGVTGANVFSSSTDTNVLNVNGYFYAVGLKYRAIAHRAFKLDLGVNYRSSATLESLYNNFVPVGVPQELAYGAALSYGTEFGLFTLSADYKNTAYEDATSESDFTIRIPDVTTTNLGFEYANSKYQLRAGTYKSTYDDGSNGDISGITAGAGIILSSYSFEVSFDNRTYTEGTQTTTVPFYTASVNMAY